jgi:hypothetical protein
MEHGMTERTYLPPKEALAATIADFEANPSLRARFSFGINAAGRSVSPHSPDATCFCALGRYAYHRGPENAPDGHVGDTAERELSIGMAEELFNINDRDMSSDGAETLRALRSILQEIPEVAPVAMPTDA